MVANKTVDRWNSILQQVGCLFLFGVLFGGLILGYIVGKDLHQASLVLLSPNEKYRAVLTEKTGIFRIDRNFEVHVEQMKDGKWMTITLFSSPDEGRPIGTERFLWSNDCEYLLLLGRHFFTVDGNNSFPNGEQLYLLLRPATDEIWCNAASQSRYQNFEIDDVAKLGFDALGGVPENSNDSVLGQNTGAAVNNDVSEDKGP